MLCGWIIKGEAIFDDTAAIKICRNMQGVNEHTKMMQRKMHMRYIKMEYDMDNTLTLGNIDSCDIEGYKVQYKKDKVP